MASEGREPRATVAVAAGEVYPAQLQEVGVILRLEPADAASCFSDDAKVLATPIQSFCFINRPVAATTRCCTSPGPASAGSS